MSDGLPDEGLAGIMLILGVVMIIIGSVITKNALDVIKFEDNATKEYVTGYVEQKAVSDSVGRSSYQSVFSFEYTLPNGTTTKQTLKINSMKSYSNANRIYPIGTTEQIVIFDQDIRTARLDIDSEKYHKIYDGVTCFAIALFSIFSFLFLIFYDNN